MNVKTPWNWLQKFTQQHRFQFSKSTASSVYPFLHQRPLQYLRQLGFDHTEAETVVQCKFWSNRVALGVSYRIDNVRTVIKENTRALWNSRQHWWQVCTSGHALWWSLSKSKTPIPSRNMQGDRKTPCILFLEGAWKCRQDENDCTHGVLVPVSEASAVFAEKRIKAPAYLCFNLKNLAQIALIECSVFSR